MLTPMESIPDNFSYLYDLLTENIRCAEDIRKYIPDREALRDAMAAQNADAVDDVYRLSQDLTIIIYLAEHLGKELQKFSQEVIPQ